MNPYTFIKPKAPGRFRVGDRVRAVSGFTGAVGTILEDLGPLGVGGRRFYQVHFVPAEGDDVRIDWPEDELLPLEPGAEPVKDSNGASETSDNRS